MTHYAAVPANSFLFVTSHSICTPDLVILKSELEPKGLEAQIIETQIAYKLGLRQTWLKLE